MGALSPLSAQFKKTARSYHVEAEEALGQRKQTEALELLNQCLQADPYFYDAYYTRGIVREQLKDFDGALTDYNIYLEINPEHTEALFSRAVLRYKQGLYQFAKDDFTKLLRLPPGETTTVFFQRDAFASSTSKIFTTQGSNKAYLFNYLGLCELKLRNYKQALTNLDSAVRLNPGDADQFLNRGMVKEKDDDIKGAMEDYQRALSINPEHSLARHNLGVLTAAHGLPEDSEKLLLESIDRNPNLPYPHAQLGYYRFNQGDFKGALEQYNQAVRIDSSDADYFLNRGLVKSKLKDYTGSLDDFSRAVLLRENFESAWFNRGNALTKLNRLQEANEDYTLAIFYNQTYGAAYYNRALNRNKLGQNEEACDDLKKASQLGIVVKKSALAKICKE